MQLTRFADYSLRVLIYLAHRDGVHTTIRDVANAYDISENHLMKVVHSLSKRGYIRALRGKGGGIQLARPPREISVGAVIREVEPPGPAECFQADYDCACRLFPQCALRGVLQTAQSKFFTTLDGYSIRDVMGSRKMAVAAGKPPSRARRVSRPARAAAASASSAGSK